ncbi:MAG: tetratricopeptide repeat protein [Planctomycetota bacterium]|nr:MAG: tetratricopeptide repeat protein [Planctomycetota bacterium]REK27006.1 MAG: tetratricopeptide repeat protein [Planctomycetota bacterium]REK47267.1 MAG: tetratricopeptide repeat protein [Planctomycetota bacterium]
MTDVKETQRLLATLCNEEKYEAAEPICRELLSRHPDDPITLRLLGIILRHSDRAGEAIEAFQEAVQLNPEDHLMHFELGSAYRVDSQMQLALNQFRKSAELNPDFAPAVNNVGALLSEFGLFSDALPWALRATTLSPKDPNFHYNLGTAQLGLGHVDTAILTFERSLSLQGDLAKVHWNLALCHLLKGNFRRGWQEHEWREKAGQVTIDDYPQPLWEGESLAGKTILLHAEQGLGDEILFASCFSEIIEQADDCIVTCDPRLTSLYVRSFPQATIYGIRRKRSGVHVPLAEKIDVQTPIGSIPRFLRNELSDFPKRRSYLVADAAKVARWRERFEQLGPGMKIGISWRTGGQPAARRTRVTSLGQWRDILSLPGVHWINLQYGDVEDEIEAERRQSGVLIHDWEEGDPLVDLDGFAARLCALDMVISVGNTSVHLAGALGVESWALLPLVPTWRWLLDGVNDNVSPWYPSVRTFRQTSQGDWSTVFRTVTELLCQRLGMAVPSSSSALDKVEPVDLNDISPDGAPVSVQRADAYALEASKLQSRGCYREAEAIYRLVLKHFPRHFNSLQLMGTLAEQTNRLPMAIRHFRRALDLIPQNAEVNFNLANVYRKVGEPELAIEHYERAIRKKPDLAAAHLNLGVTYAVQRRFADARRAYQKALELDPKLDVARENLAKLDHLLSGPHFSTKPAGDATTDASLGAPGTLTTTFSTPQMPQG